jgi:hypothetical protein
LAHAISHFNQPHSNPLYLGCLLLIALDIFILVIAARNALSEQPVINLFFRIIEIIFFLGIGITMLVQQQWLLGSIHVLLSVIYVYLGYCEKNIHSGECLGIYHMGVSIPALPDSKFFIWSKVNGIDAQYDSITINTANQRSYRFELRKNLQFEELDQIHEFCRHYLGAAH